MSERPGQAASYNNSDYGMNEEGERIVLATRRADGTYRKERRVRAGYMPPDEQLAYVSKGKQWRLEAEKDPVPGFDGDIILPNSTAQKAPMSKSAKKNAARKAKKAVQGDEQVAQQTAAPSPAKTAAPPQSGAAEPVSEEEAKEKKIRAIKKKLRQCEQIREKRDSGAVLTPEQETKLETLDELQRELDALSLG